MKSALVTVSALIIAGALVFIIWFFGFPQSMATLCEKTGNYSFALTCSARRYSKTNDPEDLARCAENAILSGNDAYVVEYGDKLISDDGFDAVCAKKDEILSAGIYGQYSASYKSYICSNVAAAYYRIGDADKAVSAALNSGSAQGFVKLVSAIADSSDAQGAQKALSALEGMTAPDAEIQLIEILKTTLEKIGE